MKIIFSLFLSLTSIFTYAQIAQEAGFGVSHNARHSFEAGGGFGLKTSIIYGLIKLKKDADVSGTPVFAAGYSYRVSPWFGIGADFTTQTMEGNYSYSLEVKNVEVSDTLTFDYSRWSIAAEPRLYYPLNTDKIELYSSVRIGYKKEKLEALSTYDDLTEILKLTDLIVKSPFNLSATLLGINYFPITNVGIGLAGNIGPTYFVKGSAILRF